MASPNIQDALKQVAASPDKSQAYETLLDQISQFKADTNLTKYLIAIIDSIFAESLGIVATRSLSIAFVKALRSVSSNDIKIEVGEHTLSIFQSQPSSFEEQNAQIREHMADAHEGEEDFLA